jgi:hypothetical protein
MALGLRRHVAALFVVALGMTTLVLGEPWDYGDEGGATGRGIGLGHVVPTETDKRHVPEAHSCEWYIRKMCRPDRDYVHFSSQLQCALQKLHKIPNYCRPAYRDMAKCLAEMQTYCADLSPGHTAHCLEEHIDFVSPECLESQYFEDLHHEAGRETTGYEESYRKNREFEMRAREEPTPLPEELPTTEGYVEEEYWL